MIPLRKFLALDPPRRRLVAEAYVLVTVASVVVRFGLVGRALARRRRDDSTAPRRAPGCGEVDDVISAVRAVAPRALLPSRCLVQALAALWALDRRGIASRIVFGVKKDDGLRAHAWLAVGDTIVLGREGSEAFSVVGAWSSSDAADAPMANARDQARWRHPASDARAARGD